MNRSEQNNKGSFAPLHSGSFSPKPDIGLLMLI